LLPGVCRGCGAGGYAIGVKTGLLHGYKLERINVILDPENADKRGFGYHTWQSIITVGEGGLTGTRASSDYSQSRLKFLPEPAYRFHFRRHRGDDWVCWRSVATCGLRYAALAIGCRRPPLPRPDRHAGDHGDSWRTYFSDFINVGMALGLLPSSACRFL